MTGFQLLISPMLKASAREIGSKLKPIADHLAKDTQAKNALRRTKFAVSRDYYNENDVPSSRQEYHKYQNLLYGDDDY